MAKPIKKIIIGSIIMGALFSLTGCLKRYSIEDMKKDAERKLEDTYGEEFVVTEIFNVQEGRAYQAYAHPIDNPNVIFDCNYNIEDKDNSSEYSSDYYIGEIVAYQYKQMAEQVLKDCKYDYYLDMYILYSADMNSKFDKNVTIEEFSKEVDYDLVYRIYISDDILAEDNQYIYNIMMDTYMSSDKDDSQLSVMIVSNYDLTSIKDDMIGQSEMTGSLSSDLSHRYPTVSYNHVKERNIGFPKNNGEDITDFEVFEKHMEEVR